MYMYENKYVVLHVQVDDQDFKISDPNLKLLRDMLESAIADSGKSIYSLDELNDEHPDLPDNLKDMSKKLKNTNIISSISKTANSTNDDIWK